MFCDCSVTVVGGERLPSPSINNAVVSPAFSHLLLFSVACLSSLPSASTMGKNNKRKREPTPPSEEFGDSEYSEDEGSPAPIPLRESSDDSDDSQGLAAEVWTYIRVVERSGLEGSDEEDSDGGGEDEDEDDDDDDDEGGGGGDGDGSGRDGSSGSSGSKDGDGGGSRGSSGGGGSSRGSTRGGSGGNRASG
jgi:hypothetical protein